MQKWESDVEPAEGSPQIAEFPAVIRALEKFEEPISLITDLAYVAGVAMKAEHWFWKRLQIQIYPNSFQNWSSSSPTENNLFV